jgi:hypothetical protein
VKAGRPLDVHKIGVRCGGPAFTEDAGGARMGGGDLFPALLPVFTALFPVGETVQEAQALRHGENDSFSMRHTKEAGIPQRS